MILRKSYRDGGVKTIQAERETERERERERERETESERENSRFNDRAVETEKVIESERDS